MELLLLIGLALVLLYIYVTWNYSYWTKRGITSDKPIFFFGSVMEVVLMRKNRALVLDELYEKFPGEKVVGYYNLRHPALLIRDPNIAHKILVTDFHSFRNNDVTTEPSDDDPFTRNLFVLTDMEWKRSRALITPAFTSGKIKAIYPLMEAVAKELTEYIKKHPEELHVKNTMARYTSEIVAKCAFGIEGNGFAEENPNSINLYKVGKNVFQPGLKNTILFSVLFFAPFLAKLFNMKLIPKDVKEFFDSVLKDVIVYRQKNNVDRNDLVHYLIELKKKAVEVEKGNIKSDLFTKAYTDEDVLAACIMFFVEAYETSALLLSHILYMLTMHRDVQKKLQREIDEKMKGGDITYEEIHEMNYLEAVIQETNRIFPVAHFFFKRCTEKYEMDLGKEKPLVIEKNMSITIPAHSYHNDPAYWEDPKTFKPERFVDKENGEGAKNKSIFMPFGEGPRMCIGVRIASTMVKLALTSVCRNFDVVPSSKTPKEIKIDPQYFMTTHKGGIYLRFTERSSK